MNPANGDNLHMIKCDPNGAFREPDLPSNNENLAVCRIEQEPVLLGRLKALCGTPQGHPKLGQLAPAVSPLRSTNILMVSTKMYSHRTFGRAPDILRHP
jgi:hypothetical protein